MKLYIILVLMSIRDTIEKNELLKKSKYIFEEIAKYKISADEESLLLLVRKIISKVKQPNFNKMINRLNSINNISFDQSISISHQNSNCGLSNNKSFEITKKFDIEAIQQNQNYSRVEKQSKKVITNTQKLSNIDLIKSNSLTFTAKKKSSFEKSLEFAQDSSEISRHVSNSFDKQLSDHKTISSNNIIFNQLSNMNDKVSSQQLSKIMNNSINLLTGNQYSNLFKLQGIQNNINSASSFANGHFADDERSIPRKNIYRDNYLDLLIEAYDTLKYSDKLQQEDEGFEEINTSVLLTDLSASQLTETKDKLRIHMLNESHFPKDIHDKAQKQCENKACTYVEYKKSNIKNFQKVKLSGTKKIINVCGLCYKAYKNKKYCYYCGLIYKDAFCNYSVDNKTWVECDYCNNWQHIECEEQKGEFKELSKLIENDNFKYMCYFCRSSKKNKESFKEEKRNKMKQPIEDDIQAERINNKFVGRRRSNVYSNDIYYYQKNMRGKKVDGKPSSGKY